MEIWYVYIIETIDNKLYTGITKNLEKRFKEHLSGVGAKFFRFNKPKKIVYYEKFDNKSLALKRECSIKKMSRVNKLYLISDF